VTDLVGISDSCFISLVRSAIDSVSSPSELSESHNVSSFIESSSVIGRGIVSGLRSFSKRFLQRRVGCLPPHSSHGLSGLANVFADESG